MISDHIDYSQHWELFKDVWQRKICLVCRNKGHHHHLLGIFISIIAVICSSHHSFMSKIILGANNFRSPTRTLTQAAVTTCRSGCIHWPNLHFWKIVHVLDLLLQYGKFCRFPILIFVFQKIFFLKIFQDLLKDFWKKVCSRFYFKEIQVAFFTPTVPQGAQIKSIRSQ